MQVAEGGLGRDALRQHTWPYWPVMAAAHQAGNVEVMWQEMDTAVHIFADQPKKIASLLGDLLPYFGPVSLFSSVREVVCMPDGVVQPWTRKTAVK